ncbi:DUF6635 family protein [Falsihalocynthiibacter arcticus]|nr:DUF6635 family protein [Falsihalocynthiibacter arcticus]
MTTMISSSSTMSKGDASGPDGYAYFADRRKRVDQFIDHHFTWPGTLHLHSAAFGWDVLRAPINVILSPVLVLTRIVAIVCRRIRLPAIANWLAARRILLPTAVSRRVEALIATDLLVLPMSQGAAACDPSALSRAVLAAPQFRELIRKRADAAEVQVLGQRIADALGDYAGTRSAVAEMTTGLVTLTVGAFVFQALTPGMISMAPGVADAMAQTTAIAEFPMGQTIGGLWYGMFPTGASPLFFATSVTILIMIGSVFAAFAGVLADPIQSRLGIHRRRLMRLIDTLEVELCGSGDKPFAVREHYYARLWDLWDIVGSAFRLFRN